MIAVSQISKKDAIMNSVTTIENSKPLNVEHCRVKINVENDIRAINPEAWDPAPGWMLLPAKKESDNWRAVCRRLGARSTVDDSFSYLFEYSLDIVTGRLIGEPTLRLTYELEDNFKPESEVIAEFAGTQARQLWDVVTGKFPPITIQHADLDTDLFW